MAKKPGDGVSPPPGHDDEIESKESGATQRSQLRPASSHGRVVARTRRPRPRLLRFLWSRLSQEEEPRFIRIGDRILIFVGIATLVTTGGIRVMSWLDDERTALDLAYYEIDKDGDPHIIHDVVTHEVSDSQLDRRTVDIPIQLAVRNQGDRVAPVTKVVVRLRPDITVKLSEESTRKVDATGQSLVYERSVKPLHPERDWTVYETVDEISLEVFSFDVPLASLSSDGIPVFLTSTYYGFVASMDAPPAGLTRELLPIDVEFYSDEGLIASDTIELEVPFRLQLATDYEGLRQPLESCPTSLGVELEALTNAKPTRTEVSARSGSQPRLDYAEYERAGHTAQTVSVDGVLRLVNVDLDGDGLIDHTATWPVRGEMSCATFDPPSPLVPWPAEAFAP